MQGITFEPLVVRAYLQTPVISNQYLPLDGIIYNHFIRDIMGPKIVTFSRQSTVEDYLGMDLPILKCNTNEPEWYYACSFAVWPESTLRSSIHYSRRFDTHLAVDYVDFKNRRGRVETQRGQYKNYFIREYTFNAPYVEWYLRGNEEHLKKLLPFCTHVGKKSSQGFGSVLRWEVQKTERDWYKNDSEGNLMRAIPSREGEYVFGIRPPYWLPRHQTKVVMP